MSGTGRMCRNLCTRNNFDTRAILKQFQGINMNEGEKNVYVDLNRNLINAENIYFESLPATDVRYHQHKTQIE